MGERFRGTGFKHALINTERDLLGSLSNLVDLHVSGTENFDAILKTPAIIVLFPHTSHLDSFFVRAALPKTVRGRLTFAAKASAWGEGWRSCAGRLVTDTIPLDTDTISTNAFTTMIKRLSAGDCIGISPEGTRTLNDIDNRPFLRGIELLLKKTDYTVPIVPIVLHGLGDILPKGASLPRIFDGHSRRKVCVDVGAPIWYRSGMEKGAITEDLRQRCISQYKRPLIV
ncbi:1-acyl-sn-glycerol-3-phosphate acyltransferase [Candidatus Roizmanbacteria bacterium]|nr:1-acyl-sn-glycerol-3-phosphate acyltransferase [Candidatus Roizmanbacteria bacterium]